MFKFLGHFLRHYSFSLFFLAVSPTVFSQWQNLDSSIPHEKQPIEQFIDLDNVKQAGPMAIYRQVMILSQGSKTLQGFKSIVSLYEFDCMNSKLRILNTTSYSEEWAKGEIVVMPPPSSKLREWVNLPSTILGKQTFDLICPSGK